MHRWPSFSVLTCLLAAGSLTSAAEPIHFGRQIRPILSENCFFCHGPDEAKREAGLRLDDEKAAKSDNDGTTAIVPGHPEKSALLQRILSGERYSTFAAGAHVLTAGFAGLLAALACLHSDVPAYLAGVISGIAGHMGAELVRLLELRFTKKQ